MQSASVKTPLGFDNKIPGITGRELRESLGRSFRLFEPSIEIDQGLAIITHRVIRIAPLFGEISRKRLKPFGHNRRGHDHQW